ncbi:DUF1127 domain-containing protein [Bradyrhizobium jicamae]|uniref:DUF1127 domain-containing protein n=1 Tax=Bradyrhizobium jicamae TaxID=280332 RepID=UPI0009FA1D14|nr:DUF1127 domain-containing protein [Bradyrhizobium jicamae]
MNTNHAAGEVRLIPAIRPVRAFFKRYWRAFQEQRSRRKLRAVLYELNDHDLKDIGISRGLIEHFVSSPTIDPRFVGRATRRVAEEEAHRLACSGQLLALSGYSRRGRRCPLLCFNETRLRPIVIRSLNRSPPLYPRLRSRSAHLRKALQKLLCATARGRAW